MASRRKNVLLIKECRDRNIEGVKVLLKDKQMDLYYMDTRTKLSTLHAICECTTTEIFKLIYPKVKSLELKDQNGRTLIYSAIKGEQSDLVELLLDYGSSLDTVDSNGQNPLEYAATFGSPDICKELIKLKKLNNKKYHTLLLELTIKTKDIPAISALLKKMKINNAIDRNGCTPLIYSCRFGDIKTIGVFLDTKVDILAVDNHQRNALLALVYRSRPDADIYERIDVADLIDMMKIVIRRGISVDSVDMYGMSAVHYAVLYQHTSIIQVLLGNKCDLNLQTTTDYNDIPIGAIPLHIAIKANNIALVKLLCKAGADCNLDMTYDKIKAKESYPISSLHLAIKKRNFDIATKLLDFGADINSHYNGGSVIYSISLVKSKRKLLELSKNILRSPEYNINMQGSDGNTILHEIFKLLSSYTDNDNLEIAKLICSSEKINFNLKNNNGETALVAAVNQWFSFHQMNPQMAGLLTEMVKAAAVDINLSDQDGNTVLHIAFTQYATSRQYYEICAKTALREFMFLLINQGCSKETKNIIKQTPLHCYASKVLERVDSYQDDAFERRRLLKGCIVKNDIDIYGNTILHYAISKHPKKFIADILQDTDLHSFDFINAKVPEKPLQQLNADYLQIRYAGMTALQIAIIDYRDCNDMINYILKCGGDVHVTFIKEHLHHTLIEQIYTYFGQCFIYVGHSYEVLSKLFHPLFLLLSAGASYVDCTGCKVPKERSKLNLIEEKLVKESSCLPMLRRAARLGYKFNSNHLNTVCSQDEKTADVLDIILCRETVFPLDVLAARILRRNLFPNAWVGSKRLNLPGLIYAEHFENYQNTQCPT